jgi:hypothetical protein
MDDIRTDDAANESEGARQQVADDSSDGTGRRVGPESEVRGGPEAPSDEAMPGQVPSPGPGPADPKNCGPSSGN